VKRAAWAAIIVFAALGVSSAFTRAVAVLAPDGAVVRVQRRLTVALNDDEPLVRQYEARFAAHPVLTLLHVVPGGLFLALAPLQFSRRIRTRHLRFHRWSGRALVVAAIVSVVPSFYFGVVHPVGGFGEVSSIALFGALTLLFVVRGFVAVRRGDVARHRRFMIRAFAAALAVSTVRIVGAVVQVLAATTPVQTITIAFWTGWLLTLAAAESYIRLTATSARTYSFAVRGTGSATR
jgi:uncharacterized membrane protein